MGEVVVLVRRSASGELCMGAVYGSCAWRGAHGELCFKSFESGAVVGRSTSRSCMGCRCEVGWLCK